MEVLTGNGTKFTIELGIPLKFNPEAAALVESRIEGGDWSSEASSVARGTLRTNVSGYETFGEFNTRRAAAVDGVLYGNEVGKQIEARINTLFCDTYAICDIVAVNVGDVIIRKVNPPSAITAEAAALEAAQLSKQTEEALNEVEGHPRPAPHTEGTGYGNLFSFLPDGDVLTAADAANFLRASAEKKPAQTQMHICSVLWQNLCRMQCPKASHCPTCSSTLEAETHLRQCSQLVPTSLNKVTIHHKNGQFKTAAHFSLLHLCYNR